MPWLVARALALAALSLVGCSSGREVTHSQQVAATGPGRLVQQVEAAGMPARLLVAGDIGQCNRGRQPKDSVRATAALMDERPGLVLVAGDIAYPDGRAVAFGECYDPAWGALRSRTLPAPGNHEYHSVNAAPYFQYFGAQAGEPGAGWYSVDFAGWHIIALNSNLPAGEGSPQLAWLRRDLAERPRGCLAAFWHHPRFSSGGHGNNTNMDAVWRVLAGAAADLVLNGHDHDYERFAPQDADGAESPTGVREFVVGSGGAEHSSFLLTKPHSEVRNADSYGILELNLSRSGYEWRFLAVEGSDFEDRGRATCHRPAS